MRIRFLVDPHTHNGRLLSGGGRGQPVHAGSHMRRRELVLDAGLLSQPRELTRIVLHELFHFVWTRLGNAERRTYETLLASELAKRARGELGWSSELRKSGLRAGDIPRRTKRWREYTCESFCDTGAWVCGGILRHPEFTLAARWREQRRRWFETLLSRNRLAI